MRLFIFLDEVYFKKGKHYMSKSNAGNFLLSFIDKYKMTFCFPVKEKKECKVATVIPSHVKVVPLDGWDSLLGYLKGIIRNMRQIDAMAKPAVRESDVVWIRLPSLPGLYIAKIALKYNKKIILHLAGDITAAYDNEKFGMIQKMLAYCMGQYMHFVTKSIISKAKSIKILCTGCILEKMYSHSATTFFVDNEYSTHVIKGNNIPRTFLYVGRLLKSKGIIDLLIAWEKASIEDAKLLIVGYGEIQNVVEEYCKCNHSVKFLGFFSGEDLKSIYEQADCLVLPSVTSEGFPRVIAEAWCNGLVVIASDIGGIRSVGIDGDNILFFEPGNVDMLCESLVRIAQDNALFKRLKCGAANAANFISKDNMLKVVENAIDNN